MSEVDLLAINNVLNNVSQLWVFGYGSILWKTGFPYERQKIGYITGYMRRFWQGSTAHRGTPENPGRVATLIHCEDLFMEEEEENGNEEVARVWGAAYELVGKPMIVEALEHLGVRECLLGGYISIMTPFYERSSSSSSPSPPQISVLMFTATESNELFLGPADSLDELAAQIVSCRGPCGNNVQYVVQLANYMRENIPEENDAHLFGLVERIEAQCAAREMNIEELVNEVIADGKTTEHACPKCKVLCTEYAFCQDCRAETVQDELTIGMETLPEAAETQDDDTISVESTYTRRRYSVSQRRRSSVSQQRRSSILASVSMTNRRRRSSLLEILQDEAAKQSVQEAAE